MKFSLAYFAFFMVGRCVVAQNLRLVLPIGHTGDITSAKFSPDSRFILTTAADTTAKLWDTYTGKEVYTFVLHHEIISANFSADSKYIITIEKYGEAIVWEVVSGNIVKKLVHDPREYSLISAGFSPDGNLIVTTSTDRNARIWDAYTGKELHVLHHTYDMKSATFSPDGKFVITASLDNTAKVWETKTGKELHSLNHPSSVYYAMFSPDGKYIMTCSEYFQINIWDAHTMKKLQTLVDEKGANDANFSSDSKYIVTASFDEKAKLWDVSTGKQLGAYPHFNMIHSASFSPDGRYIVTASLDSTAKVWDVETGKPVFNLRHSSGLQHACFSPNGNYILTNSFESADIFDAKTGIHLFNLAGKSFKISSINISPNNKYIVLTSQKTAKLFDVYGGKLLHNLLHPETVTYARFSPDSRYVATTCESNSVILWNVATGKPVFNFEHQDEWILQTGFSPDGKYIATISPHVVKIWNATTGKLLHKLVHNEWSSAGRNNINTFSFSSDNKFLATGTDDRYITIWNIHTGKIYKRLTESSAITSVDFSPGNSRIVSVNYPAGICKIWDINSGMALKSLNNSNTSLYQAAYSKDGKRIIAFSGSETVVYDAKTFKQLNNIAEGRDRENDHDVSNTSPDGTYYSTYSYGSNVNNLWNVLTGKIVYSLVQPREIISSIFSPLGTYVATNSYDNTIRLWNTQNGLLIYSFIPIYSNDYITLIASGYYMSSKEASRLLHYVTKDLKIVTFGQLDIKYNRPDKVLEAIGSPDTALIKSYHNAYLKRIKKLDIDTTAFREGYSVPEADFVNRDSINNNQTKEELQFSIHGTDSTYVLDHFNVWVNEVPVFGLRGINIRGRNRRNFDTTVTITLSQGDNQIQTSVTNSNGTESYRKPLVVRYTPAVLKKEKMYFIGIGINHFADSAHNLNWSVKDIKDLSVTLQEKYKDTIEIDTLFDKNVTVAKVKFLKEKLKASSVNDKVIVAYSGHGLLSRDYDYYLSAYNINFDRPEENGLPYDELENLLDSIPARKKLMLIDACQSGEVDKDEMTRYVAAQKKLDSMGIKGGVILINKDSSRIGMKNSFELMQELFVNVGKSTGATIISAAAGTQFALERNNLQNGVFTYSILEYMQQHSHADINEIKQYVNQRVTELTDGLQVPTTRNENIELNWAVW